MVNCIDNITAEYVQVVPLSHLMMRRRSEHVGMMVTTQQALTALCSVHCDLF